ncbi:Xre family toxin-antitoxin system [Lactobacillus helveticus]|nr:Xre family toxin-antitoxin system [Lactobacillus helveticus]
MYLNTLALIFIITGNFFIASKEYKQIRRLSAQELKEISEELDK